MHDAIHILDHLPFLWLTTNRTLASLPPFRILSLLTFGKISQHFEVNPIRLVRLVSPMHHQSCLLRGNVHQQSGHSP